MARRRRRRTIEERITAAEEQLAALRTKQLTYREHRAAQNGSFPERRTPPRLRRRGQRKPHGSGCLSATS